MRMKPAIWFLLAVCIAAAVLLGMMRLSAGESAMGDEATSQHEGPLESLLTNAVPGSPAAAGEPAPDPMASGALDPEAQALVEAFHSRYPGAFDATTEAQRRWLQERGFPTTAEFLAFRQMHRRYAPMQSRHVTADPRGHMLLADLALEHLMALQQAGQGMDGPDGASTEFTMATIDAMTSLRHAASARAPVFVAYQHAQLEALLGSVESQELFLGVAASCGDARLSSLSTSSAGRAKVLPVGVRDLLLAGRDVPGCRAFGLRPFPLDDEDGRLPDIR